MKKIFMLVVLIVVWANVFSQEAPKQHIVANVNGVPITRGELHKRLEERFGKIVLDQLIVEELIRQDAEKKKIKVSEKEIQEKIDEIKKQVGSQEKFNEVLKQNNMTEKDVRDQIKIETTLEKILEANVGKEEIKAVQKEKKVKETDAKRIVIMQKVPEYLNSLKKKAKIEINL